MGLGGVLAPQRKRQPDILDGGVLAHSKDRSGDILSSPLPRIERFSIGRHEVMVGMLHSLNLRGA